MRTIGLTYSSPNGENYIIVRLFNGKFGVIRFEGELFDFVGDEVDCNVHLDELGV